MVAIVYWRYVYVVDHIIYIDIYIATYIHSGVAKVGHTGAHALPT